jgi:hypothetical protein
MPARPIVLVALTLATAMPPAASAERPHYEIEAVVSLGPPQVRGTVAIDFFNSSGAVLRDVVLVLFPNRFTVPEASLNDFNHPFVYPDGEFSPGGMRVTAVEVDGAAARLALVRRAGLPEETFVRVPVPPTAPGERRRLTLRFETQVPRRFGSFGVADDRLTLVGGWYPYVAGLGADGQWLIDAPPPLASFRAIVTATDDLELIVHGRSVAAGGVATVEATAHYLSAVAARGWQRRTIEVEGTTLTLLHRPLRWSVRVAPGPNPTERLLDAAARIVRARPAALPGPGAELLLVEAPLRLRLTAPAEGMVVVSDRTFHLHEILHPLHELQVAQAVYRELLRPQLAPREPTVDAVWVNDGLAHWAAARYMAREHPGIRTVQDWIELFNIFAIVDRFESAPQVPFVEAFFERTAVADPLHADVTTFNHTTPPGHVVIGKVCDLLGPAACDQLVDQCLAVPLPFRACAAAADPALGRYLEMWLGPCPRINYWIESARLNVPENGRFRHHLVVRRRASRPFAEYVTVRLRSIGGAPVDLHWQSPGDIARMSAVTERRVAQAVVDPDKRLIEERRDDNARPPSLQMVLDTAEVEVSSTEFGFAGSVVGRMRYDYRKDVKVAGFYTNRSLGVTAGPRLHWGPSIDATRYRHNVYLFFGAEALDGDFTDERRPTVRTDGISTSFSARYAYTNSYGLDNPSRARHVLLFADWHDAAIGSDFDYVTWGAGLTLTHPLGTSRTIGAVQLFNGLGEPVGDSRVPNQDLFSLGGGRSIRGIGAEDELGENICLVRGELRQDLRPDVDLNLLDLLVWRRTQARLFVDSGRVDNRVADIYDVGDFAVGAGVGLAAGYEFMGFFPSLAYIEVATRVDRRDQLDAVQVRFGTRQAF